MVSLARIAFFHKNAVFQAKTNEIHCAPKRAIARQNGLHTQRTRFSYLPKQPIYPFLLLFVPQNELSCQRKASGGLLDVSSVVFHPVFSGRADIHPFGLRRWATTI